MFDSFFSLFLLCWFLRFFWDIFSLENERLAKKNTLVELFLKFLKMSWKKKITLFAERILSFRKSAFYAHLCEACREYHMVSSAHFWVIFWFFKCFGDIFRCSDWTESRKSTIFGASIIGFFFMNSHRMLANRIHLASNTPWMEKVPDQWRVTLAS